MYLYTGYYALYDRAFLLDEGFRLQFHFRLFLFVLSVSVFVAIAGAKMSGRPPDHPRPG